MVIVASKGGADNHPEWYLNLREQDHVDFQIATQAFRATWREPEGDERHRVWDFMVRAYPPYISYQRSTTRHIPVVMMTPRKSHRGVPGVRPSVLVDELDARCLAVRAHRRVVLHH